MKEERNGEITPAVVRNKDLCFRVSVYNCRSAGLHSITNPRH